MLEVLGLAGTRERLKGAKAGGLTPVRYVKPEYPYRINKIRDEDSGLTTKSKSNG